MSLIYELDIKSWSELWFFLFRPKKCPVCRGKLQRLDVLPEQSAGWGSEWSGANFSVEHVYRTKDKIKYRCPKCHAYYWLSELVARRKVQSA